MLQKVLDLAQADKKNKFDHTKSKSEYIIQPQKINKKQYLTLSNQYGQKQKSLNLITTTGSESLDFGKTTQEGIVTQ